MCWYYLKVVVRFVYKMNLWSRFLWKRRRVIGGGMEFLNHLKMEFHRALRAHWITPSEQSAPRKMREAGVEPPMLTVFNQSFPFPGGNWMRSWHGAEFYLVSLYFSCGRKQQALDMIVPTSQWPHNTKYYNAEWMPFWIPLELFTEGVEC